MQFQDYIGQIILFQIPRFDEFKYWKFKVLGVDAGGVWVENQEVTDALLHSFGLQTMPKTPVFFLPYHVISLVLAPMDVVALDEKSFGL